MGENLQEVQGAVTNIKLVDDRQAPLPGFDLPDLDSGHPATGQPKVPATAGTGERDVFPVYPFI
jgi:hypothetical protein